MNKSDSSTNDVDGKPTKVSRWMDTLESAKNFGNNNHKDFKFEEYGALKRSYPHGFHGVDRFGRPIYSKWIGSLNSTYKGERKQSNLKKKQLRSLSRR